MANPLARVVMNNITQRNGIVSTSLRASINSSNVSNIDNKEEQLLKSVIRNSSDNLSSNKVLSSLDSLNSYKTHARTSSFKQNDTIQSRSSNVNKIALEELAKGNKVDKKENKTYKKSSTMMTLNELAGKVKKNAEEKTEVNETNFQKSNGTNYVRASVINNLEAYIPKVSLNSIGKKGSLLK